MSKDFDDGLGVISKKQMAQIAKAQKQIADGWAHLVAEVGQREAERLLIEETGFNGARGSYKDKGLSDAIRNYFEGAEEMQEDMPQPREVADFIRSSPPEEWTADDQRTFEMLQKLPYEEALIAANLLPHKEPVELVVSDKTLLQKIARIRDAMFPNWRRKPVSKWTTNSEGVKSRKVGG